MKPSQANIIKNTLASILTLKGFVRKGGSYYRRHGQFTNVINLQRSQYGKSYYLNIAIFDPRLLKQEFPKEQLCHVRLRIEVVPGVNASNATRLLDLESPIEQSVRVDGLRDIVDSVLLFFDCSKTYRGLRELESRGELRGAFIHRLMRRPDMGEQAGTQSELA